MPMQENGLVIIDGNDIGKTDIEILMDLIYETNKIRIPQEHIVYHIPKALDQRPEIMVDENTFIPIKVDPNWDASYAKAEGFLYRRQDLTEYFQEIDIAITAPSFPFTIRSIWDEQVKPFLPYPIDKKDIQDYLFTDLHAVAVTVHGHPDSLLWCGSVKIVLNPINPAFFKLCPVTAYLTGFTEFTTTV